MSRRAQIEQAARWVLGDGARTPHAPPHGADALGATLDDPALGEALSASAALGRLSDAEVHAMRARRRRVITGGGVAMLVFGLGLGTWSGGWLEMPGATAIHYQTARGEHRDIRLADGSTIQLNGDTSLDVRMSAGQRLVEMQRGEAFFDVAHDPRRPFAVHAGDSGARVLGTAFDVDMARGEVKLAVYRGKVRFGRFAREDDGVLVAAGWRSRFSRGVARAPTPFDAAQQDWRQNWLDTDAMRLGELVDSLNRQAGPLIEPPAPGLARIAVSGRFKLDDPQQLLGAIGEAYGFSIRRDGDRLRLVADSTPEDSAQHSAARD